MSLEHVSLLRHSSGLMDGSSPNRQWFVARTSSSHRCSVKGLSRALSVWPSTHTLDSVEGIRHFSTRDSLPSAEPNVDNISSHHQFFLLFDRQSNHPTSEHLEIWFSNLKCIWLPLLWCCKLHLSYPTGLFITVCNNNLEYHLLLHPLQDVAKSSKNNSEVAWESLLEGETANETLEPM